MSGRRNFACCVGKLRNDWEDARRVALLRTPRSLRSSQSEDPLRGPPHRSRGGLFFGEPIDLVDKFVLLLLLHVKIEGFFRIINFCVVGEIFN